MLYDLVLYTNKTNYTYIFLNTIFVIKYFVIKARFKIEWLFKTLSIEYRDQYCLKASLLKWTD